MLFTVGPNHIDLLRALLVFLLCCKGNRCVNSVVQILFNGSILKSYLLLRAVIPTSLDGVNPLALFWPHPWKRNGISLGHLVKGGEGELVSEYMHTSIAHLDLLCQQAVWLQLLSGFMQVNVHYCLYCNCFCINSKNKFTVTLQWHRRFQQYCKLAVMLQSS